MRNSQKPAPICCDLANGIDYLDAIHTAVIVERERCAEIVEASGCQIDNCLCCGDLRLIAAAIRSDKFLKMKDILGLQKRVDTNLKTLDRILAKTIRPKLRKKKRA